MQLKLYGNTNLLMSVHANRVQGGMDLLINTRDRGAGFCYRGSSFGFMEAWADNGQIPEHIAFEVSHPKNEEDLCEIVLVPETQEEVGLLRSVKHFHQEKEQISVILMNTISKEPLVAWQSDTPDTSMVHSI